MNAIEALSAPTRRRIVELLAVSDQDAGELGSHFNVSQPAISHHLRVLRESGLVRVRPEAQRRIYSLDPAPLEQLDEWLQRYRGFWTQRLDALDTELQRGRRRKEQ